MRVEGEDLSVWKQVISHQINGGGQYLSGRLAGSGITVSLAELIPFNGTVKRKKKKKTPEVWADPEQR